jgi:Na+-driven multidrug efflux pump
MKIYCASLVGHALSGYWFIVVWKYDLTGIAIANTVSNTMNFILITYVSTRLNKYSVAFYFPDREAFKGLKEYLKIAIPSMLLHCLKSWSFALQILISSIVSVELLAA